MMNIKPKPQSVRKFYFLEYIYVLLKSAETYNNIEKVFNHFKILKQKHLLGESKYKKLTIEGEELSKTQENRYRYTFNQVIYEAKDYGLISNNNHLIYLTKIGKSLLNVYNTDGLLEFNRRLIPLMEKEYHAFYYLVKFCYEANRNKGGFIIFPNYSPLKLGIERARIKTVNDIINYSEKLIGKFKEDFKEYLGIRKDFKDKNGELINRLIKSGLLSSDKRDKFVPQKYNTIIKRIRDFWYNFFLRDIYSYQYSFPSFDIWVYRGKQTGILHATEFYPNFSGRIVYPTSILIDYKASKDFLEVYKYNDNKLLYIHNPNWNKGENQNDFIKSLTNVYIDIKKLYRSYFINLADIRELVCYNLKIPEYLFDEFLKEAYKLNLTGKLNVNFSLEADRLPQETSAMYLKREPVMIDGKYRNIIAVDITRRNQK